MMESTYSVSSLEGFVSSKRRLHLAAELLRQAKIQADRFCMPNVQITIRLGRKTGVHTTLVFAIFQVFENDVSDEV